MPFNKKGKRETDPGSKQAGNPASGLLEISGL